MVTEDTPANHTLKIYDRELDHLAEVIGRMGEMAENQLAGAVRALVERDPELGAQIAGNDAQVDALEFETHELVVRLLALRQPVARDLRTILAALRIASELERIADYAANVAKRAVALAHILAVEPIGGVQRMGRFAHAMIRDVLTSYQKRDLESAMAVWLRDKELDEMYTGVFRELLTYMMEDPRSIAPCAHLLFIARNLERVGDHVTNIAEALHFQIKGEPFREPRPKADVSAFTIVEPRV
jgi:phosphate transport system protein